ncbi:MAG: RNA polymerase sigma factor [Ruminococcus sp.]|nr:RNA polymerase sigma factor [Ruminococcus sp.]
MITGSEEAAYKKYFDMVWRVCFVMTDGSSADCEDACSDTFMRYIQQSRQNGFEDQEHEKAWLIVTARNVCHSMHRRLWRRDVPLEEAAEISYTERAYEPSGVMEEILKLPEKEKMAILLHYYEDMSAQKIAEIYSVSENTVFSWLHRGRKKLEKRLEGQQ